MSFPFSSICFYNTVVIGSFAPSEKPETFEYEEEVVPSGMLARGKYRAKCRFYDDDGNVHLEFEYQFGKHVIVVEV